MVDVVVVVVEDAHDSSSSCVVGGDEGDGSRFQRLEVTPLLKHNNRENKKWRTYDQYRDYQHKLPLQGLSLQSMIKLIRHWVWWSFGSMWGSTGGSGPGTGTG